MTRIRIPGYVNWNKISKWMFVKRLPKVEGGGTTKSFAPATIRRARSPQRTGDELRRRALRAVVNGFGDMATIRARLGHLLHLFTARMLAYCSVRNLANGEVTPMGSDVEGPLAEAR